MSCDNSRDTYDALYQLYVKQSLSFETICDLLELKKLDVVQALEKEMNDDELNEVLRSTYGKVAQQIGGKTNVAEKIAEQLGLEYEKPKDAEVNVYSPELSTDFLEVHPCPVCKGAGWTVLFMYRRDCELCEGKCEVDGVKLREYEEENQDNR